MVSGYYMIRRKFFIPKNEITRDYGRTLNQEPTMREEEDEEE